MEQLENNPGPNEREEIERVLSKIQTALKLLDPHGPTSGAEQQDQPISTGPYGSAEARAFATFFPGAVRY